MPPSRTAAPALVVGLTLGLAAGQDPSLGTVAGLVRFVGQAPQPRTIENTTDPEVCGRVQALGAPAVSAGGGVVSAIVALEDGPIRADSPPPGRLVLDNRQCRFIPRVAVLTTGSTLEVRNSDPTLHTVHLYGPMEINLALPLQGMRVERRLDRPGLIIVKCDVHGWMQAFIRVDPHPFHAVTDPGGAFQIAGVPPGDYTLSVWHEQLGRQARRVRVGAGTTTEVEIVYGREAAKPAPEAGGSQGPSGRLGVQGLGCASERGGAQHVRPGDRAGPAPCRVDLSSQGPALLNRRELSCAD